MTGNKKFVIGLSNKYDEYVIYYINRDTDSGLIYLRRYDNKDIAMQDLIRYSLLGTTDEMGDKILDAIYIHLSDNINTHDFIRSIFTIFSYGETSEFQEVISIIDSIEKTDNNLVYKSILDHLTNIIYPDNNELRIYVIMYYLSESIYKSLNVDTLYDPNSNIVSTFINQIMTIFEYTPIEISEV